VMTGAEACSRGVAQPRKQERRNSSKSALLEVTNQDNGASVMGVTRLLLLLSIASSEALLASHPLASAANGRPTLARMALLGEDSALAIKEASPLSVADNQLLSRVVRVANHASALASLAYFGLVSSTMQMPTARMPMATLASVITRRIGPTTNTQFSAYFTTLVTPASYVFLIWPTIAALQLLTLAISIFRPKLDANPQNSLAALATVGTGEPLSQSELSSLTLANTAATLWLFVSSNSVAGSISIASALLLPLVPLFAAYPLRSSTPPPAPYRTVFQVFSSFTAIASCLALAVELQYGGRVPFFGGRPELCGAVFLSLVGALISLPKRSLGRRAVTTFALSGVVARRLIDGGAAASLLLSPTFVGATALLAWSVKKLLKGDE
jgi:hypothetical protein